MNTDEIVRNINGLNRDSRLFLIETDDCKIRIQDTLVTLRTGSVGISIRSEHHVTADRDINACLHIRIGEQEFQVSERGITDAYFYGDRELPKDLWDEIVGGQR